MIKTKARAPGGEDGGRHRSVTNDSLLRSPPSEMLLRVDLGRSSNKANRIPGTGVLEHMAIVELMFGPPFTHVPGLFLRHSPAAGYSRFHG